MSWLRRQRGCVVLGPVDIPSDWTPPTASIGGPPVVDAGSGCIGTVHQCQRPDPATFPPEHVWECGGCHKRYVVAPQSVSANPSRGKPVSAPVTWPRRWVTYTGPIDPLPEDA